MYSKGPRSNTMEDSTASSTSRENPRTRRVRELVLKTAVEVLVEQGAADVTAAIVADRADVARTTIYRHWPDQRSLLLATLELMTVPHHVDPATGPLQRDVRHSLELLRTRLVARPVRSIFGALAAHSTQDDAFRDGQHLFVQQLTRPTVTILEAAQLRGELPSTIDCTFEATMLTGPLLHQHLALAGDISDELIDQVARRWLAAIEA